MVGEDNLSDCVVRGVPNLAIMTKQILDVSAAVYSAHIVIAAHALLLLLVIVALEATLAAAFAFSHNEEVLRAFVADSAVLALEAMVKHSRASATRAIS